MSYRAINLPSIPEGKNVLAVENGGFGGRNPQQSAQRLGLVTEDMVGRPFGLIPLNALGRPAASALPNNYRDIAEPTLYGPSMVSPDGSATLTITNYDVFTQYSVSARGGTANQIGDKIFFTANTSDNFAYLTVNGMEYRITVQAPFIYAPSIDNATLSVVGATLSGTFHSSPFIVSADTDTHVATDWQISESMDFSTVVQESLGDTTNLRSWTVQNLEPSKTYHVRAKYYGANYVSPAWSPVYSITTSAMGEVLGIAGPNELIIRTTASFSILGYNANNIYVLEFSPGVTGSRTGNTIYIDPPVSLGTIWIRVNGVQKNISVTPYYPTVTQLGNFGPIEMSAQRIFNLEPYIDYAEYTIAVSPGSSWTRAGGQITVTASPMVGAAWIEVNGTRFDFQITYPVPATPILSLTNQVTNVDKINVTVQGSVFAVTGFVGTHSASDWEISLNADFSNPLTVTTSNSTIRDRTFQKLEPSTTYYVRVRYYSSTGTVSAWGSMTVQTTAWGLITSVSGVNTLQAGSITLFTIEGFQAGAPYRVTTSAGSTFVRTNESITLTAAQTGLAAWLEVNGIRKDLVLTYPVPTTPTINAPTLTTVGDKITASMATTAFSVENNIGTHVSTDWNVSLDPTFATVVASSLNNPSHLTTWLVPNLTPGTTYYVRARHHSSGGTVSAWATRVVVTTGWGTVTALNGSQTVQAGTTVTYTIEGYQSSAPYQVSVSAGSTYERFGNEVYVTVQTSGTTGWVRVNQTQVDFTITYPIPSTPSIAEPSLQSENDKVTASFTASAFQVANNAGTYLSSDWQLSLVSDFMTTVKAASSLASLNWSANNLTPGTTYYVRVRHRSSGGTVSSWGVRAFNTTALGSVTAITGPDTLMTG